MLKIKLSPRGKKHQITYRLVVAESRSKLTGKYVDNIGFYTPQTKTLKIDKVKFVKWQKNGAQVTLGVDKLLNPDKYPPKPKKKKKQKQKKETPKENKKVTKIKKEKTLSS